MPVEKVVPVGNPDPVLVKLVKPWRRFQNHLTGKAGPGFEIIPPNKALSRG